MNAIGSAGSTAAFIIGACNVALVWQLWANVITFLVSVPGLLYTCFKLIEEDTMIVAATTHIEDVDNAEAIDDISKRENLEVRSIREGSLGSEC